MHQHTHPSSPNRTLKIALLVTVLLVTGEMIAGRWASSLALISDAWHNLTDLPSISLALLAAFIERRPADHRKTYGYQRAGVLAAFVNSLMLLGVATFILYEAYVRLLNPVPIRTGVMVAAGLSALIINGGISWGLASKSREDINLRAVFIHNLGDAASNLGIVVGAITIHYTGLSIIDPMLSVIISGMIGWSAWGILRETSNILLEGLPKGIDLPTVAQRMLTVPGVQEVHDVHIWSLNSNRHALSCHVLILDMVTSESEKIRLHMQRLLVTEFNITHCTIQFEHTNARGKYHRIPKPNCP